MRASWRTVCVTTWLLVFSAVYGLRVFTDPLNLTIGTVGIPIRVVWSREVGDPCDLSLFQKGASGVGSGAGIKEATFSIMRIASAERGSEMITFESPGCAWDNLSSAFVAHDPTAFSGWK